MNGFQLILKDNRTEMETLVTRVMLVIAAVAAYVYATEWNYYAGLALSFLLLLSSVFVKTIVDKFKINRLVLLGLAALLTFVTTRSLGVAVGLILLGIFLHLLKRKIRVELKDDEIIIHHVFHMRPIPWDKLNNVILKDRILTIDFKSDKLMQAEIASESFDIDEKLFNGFCTRQLQKQA